MPRIREIAGGGPNYPENFKEVPDYLQIRVAELQKGFLH
jgi:hypothetical protein